MLYQIPTVFIHRYTGLLFGKQTRLYRIQVLNDLHIMRRETHEAIIFAIMFRVDSGADLVRSLTSSTTPLQGYGLSHYLILSLSLSLWVCFFRFLLDATIRCLRLNIRYSDVLTRHQHLISGKRPQELRGRWSV